MISTSSFEGEKVKASDLTYLKLNPIHLEEES